MPNWVYNDLTIEGHPDSVAKLKAQVSKPFKVPFRAIGDLHYKAESVSYDNPVFAFWNIVAPKDLEAYCKVGDREGMKDPYMWYNWNNRIWGVKWDVAVANNEKDSITKLVRDEPNGENHVLVYTFNTPWGIPDGALLWLSVTYPDLLFTLQYEEENGWGGEHEYLRGLQLEGSFYNWKCCECDYAETGKEPYCEACEDMVCPSCGYQSGWSELDSCPLHVVESDPIEEKV